MCSNQHTGLTTDKWWFDSQQVQETFQYRKATALSLGTAGVKWSEGEADQSPSSSAGVGKV